MTGSALSDTGNNALAASCWDGPPRVAPRCGVAFHDFTPAWPGVVDAVRALGLDGETHGALFIWRKPAHAEGKRSH